MRHAVITALLLLQTGIAVGATITPEGVQRLVRKVGARQAVQTLSANEVAFETVLAGVASGGDAWLHAAVALSPGLDAHPGEAVQLSLGTALKIHPERVLQIAAPTFAIESICSGPDVDEYEHLDPALAELQARRNRVQAISAPSLAAQKQRCLAALTRPRHHSAHSSSNPSVRLTSACTGPGPLRSCMPTGLPFRVAGRAGEAPVR